MELKSFLVASFRCQRLAPFERRALYDLYGTSDVIVIRERKQESSENNADGTSSQSNKCDKD
jgi:hypothetical protein